MKEVIELIDEAIERLTDTMGPYRSYGFKVPLLQVRDELTEQMTRLPGDTYDGSHLWIGDSGGRVVCLAPEQVEALVTHLESWLNRGSLRFTFEREDGE